MGATNACDAKPVASTMTSVGRSVPSAVRMPDGVTSAIRSVTSSTFGFVSVGYHSSVSIRRLQPIESVGVTLARSSGSAIALVMLRRPAASNGLSSHGLRVIAIAPSSMKAKVALRSSFWIAGNRSNRRLVRSL